MIESTQTRTNKTKMAGYTRVSTRIQANADARVDNQAKLFCLTWVLIHATMSIEMKMDLYTQQDVSKITGLSPNTVQSWIKDDLLHLSFNQLISQGKHRNYIASDIVQLAVIKRLSKLGITRDIIRRLDDFLQETPPARLNIPNKKRYLDPDKISDNKLITLQFRDGDWQIVTYDESHLPTSAVSDILQGSTTVILININRVIEELRGRL